MISLDGAVVCVTGAGRGIGRATATELARRGARSGLATSTPRRRRARRPNRCQVDASRRHQADSLEAFWAAAASTAPSDARQQRRDHAAGTVPGPEPRRASPRDRGEPRGSDQRYARVPPRHVGPQLGHIVNVASMAAKVTTPGIAVYCASKFAVAALSRAVRAEIAPPQ